MNEQRDREDRQREWSSAALNGPGGMSFDPRSVYPSFPSRQSYIDWNEAEQ